MRFAKTSKKFLISSLLVIVTVKQWIAKIGNLERVLKMVKELGASKELQQIKILRLCTALVDICVQAGKPEKYSYHNT